MTKIKASDLPSPDSIAPACLKYYKPLSKKKKKPIDMDAIGTPTYNVLFDLMKCQVKHPNKTASSNTNGDDVKAIKSSCIKVERAYSACHAAVMGVGNYNGSKHCGEQMERLFTCVNLDVSLP